MRFRSALGALTLAAVLPGGVSGAVDVVPKQRPRCDGRPATIVGSARADTIRGTARADVIVALGGADVVDGGGGADRICLGAGNDAGEGRAGNDVLFGGPGADHLGGGLGDDVLSGGPGADELLGGTGDNRLAGGRGRDGCANGRAARPTVRMAASARAGTEGPGCEGAPEGAPIVTPIVAEFTRPTTQYSVVAKTASEISLTAGWVTKPRKLCGTFTPSAPSEPASERQYVAAWVHPHDGSPGSCPAEELHPATISLFVCAPWETQFMPGARAWIRYVVRSLYTSGSAPGLGGPPVVGREAYFTSREAPKLPSNECPGRFSFFDEHS